MDARHFHIAPMFPYIQGETPCSEPGCHRTAVYATIWPAKVTGDQPDVSPRYWRAMLICREHFEEAKRQAEEVRKR